MRALNAFDQAVVRLESARSLSELELAFNDAAQAYPFRAAAYSWWSHPPPARAPDFQIEIGDLNGHGHVSLPAAGDLWADSRPIIQTVTVSEQDDPVNVRVALLGPRRRFGVLTALLSIRFAEVQEAEIEWRGRFLLLAHVVQHSVGLWRADQRPSLGRREIQCLKLAADGLKAKQIAIALGIGQQTVQFHLSRAREKLNCSNTVQAVARAAQFGLLPDTAPAHGAPPKVGFLYPPAS